MALFQKKPQVSDSAPLYTLGLHKTVLVVGLGNIGSEYQKTRHNIGFRAVEAFVDSQSLDTWVEKKDLKCLQASGNVGSTRVITVKPTTMMNLSGQAVQAVANFYKITNDQILVVHDELDMPFGQLRVRKGGSSAGNNGVESIIQHLDNNFLRLRIGIDGARPEGMSGADFVLAKFTDGEEKQILTLLKETTALITEFAVGGNLPHDTRTWLVE